MAETPVVEDDDGLALTYLPESNINPILSRGETNVSMRVIHKLKVTCCRQWPLRVSPHHPARTDLWAVYGVSISSPTSVRPTTGINILTNSVAAFLSNTSSTPRVRV